MTLEDIAGKFRLNKERIRQIKERALHKIRHNPNGCMLKDYLCQ
jgi:DNA-directed RNA polymerase sigma subunit (sigma70/sigma32)